MRYRVAPVALAATLAIAAVCGDSDRDAPFTFTPVPYTVVATSATPPGEMLVVDEGNGSLYVADEVLATVNAREEKVFSAWATGVGFEEIDVIELVQGQVIVHLRVPPGSVDEAIAFIEAARSDVIEANRNVLATLDRP